MIQKSKEWGAEVEKNILNENREGCSTIPASSKDLLRYINCGIYNQ